MLLYQKKKNSFITKKIVALFYLAMVFSTSSSAQQGVTTIGFQVKPIIPINYFGAGPIDLSITDTASINISSKMGYCFGMVIRQGITKSVSLETGINYTRRNYKLTGSSPISNTTDTADFGFVSYEIPFQGLIYIRLADQLYMNTAVGVGINFYASDVASKGRNFLIDHYSERAYWANLSFLSNLGVEYRTKEKGYFYIGASLNTPLWPVALTNLKYYYQDNNSVKFEPTYLNGNYLTLDLRYLLPPNEKKKKD
jgi:hypothetical protein